MSKTPIDIMLDNVDWVPIDRQYSSIPQPNELYATHGGIMKVGNAELEVFILNNGERVISAESLERFFGEGFGSELKNLLA